MRRLLMSLIALVVLNPGGSAGELVAPLTTRIPAGPFLAGSNAEERAYAYRLDEQAYGHSTTREQAWYERCSSGPQAPGARRASSSRAAPGTTRAAGSAVPPPATRAPRTSSTS